VLDKNGDGSITHVEFIIGLKKHPWVAEKLGMPANVRQEDGTRESYQLSFGKIDNDNSKSIEFRELCGFFGYYDDGDLLSDWSGESRGEGAGAGNSGDSYKSFISASSRTASPAPPAHTAAPPVVLGGPAVPLRDAKTPAMTALEVINIFKTLDINGDGEVSHAEFIKGLKLNPSIAEKLGMPTEIRAEDGTRGSYQLAFGQIDNDGSKTIDLTELLEFYGHLGLGKDKLRNLLILCGYNHTAIRDIFGRAGLMSASVSSLSSADLTVDAAWGEEAGRTALSQVSQDTRRAEMLRKKKREHFLKRMAAEAGNTSVSSATSRTLSESSRHSTGTGTEAMPGDLSMCVT